MLENLYIKGIQRNSPGESREGKTISHRKQHGEEALLTKVELFPDAKSWGPTKDGRHMCPERRLV